MYRKLQIAAAFICTAASAVAFWVAAHGGVDPTVLDRDAAFLVEQCIICILVISLPERSKKEDPAGWLFSLEVLVIAVAYVGTFMYYTWGGMYRLVFILVLENISSFIFWKYMLTITGAGKEHRHVDMAVSVLLLINMVNVCLYPITVGPKLIPWLSPKGNVIYSVITYLIYAAWIYIVITEKSRNIKRKIMLLSYFIVPQIICEYVERLTGNFRGYEVTLIGMMIIYMSVQREHESEMAAQKSDIAMAARIQNSMLEKEFINDGRLDIFASMDAAKEVGGDYYDFYRIDERHVMISVGDVSGKGIPAALFMVRAKNVTRECAIRYKEPGMILTEANAELCRDNGEFMFVTSFVGVYDIEEKVLRYCNAGQTRPVVIHEGRAAFLTDVPDTMLGVTPSWMFAEHEIGLESGDTVVLYTDGVTEANDPKGEFYGEERLLKAVFSANEDARSVVKSIRQSVREHTDNAEQYDDVTILAMRVH